VHAGCMHWQLTVQQLAHVRAALQTLLAHLPRHDQELILTVRIAGFKATGMHRRQHKALQKRLDS
jgi:hemerythrin